MGAPLVECRGLGKAYRRFASPWGRLLETASLGALVRHTPFWALREVDLELARGASLGVVGANGAGKSTLQKLLAGTTRPSAGALRVDGRVAALLELGAGFQRDLTGRENLALAGGLMGFTRRELRAREGAILDFAGLAHVADEPLRTYSTGMAMRLGFALATEVEPDLLVLDEVLAVGDQAFQERCVERVLAVRARGASLVFCSHSLYDVRQLCERALWLDDGRVRQAGPADEVTAAYAASARALATEERSPAAHAPRLTQVRVVDPAGGAEVARARSGRALEVHVAWESPRGDSVQVGVGFLRHDRTLCAAATTGLDRVQLGGAGGRAVLELPALELLSGAFTVQVVLFDAAGVHRHHELARELTVLAPGKELGLVRLRHGWRVEQPVARAAG